MKLRKTTSLTALLSFILLLGTGIVLYMTPQGKIAFWANWKMLGLGKEEWGALHTNVGILFMVASLIHIVLNWGPIVAYMKNKAKKLTVFTPDFNVALIITLFIAVSTLFGLPPVKGIQTFNHSLKQKAAEKYGEPPYGHAEASSLKTFCRRTRLDLGDALKKLKKADLASVSAEASLAEIAEANDMTPQQVYDTIKPAPDPDGTGEFPKKPGMGFGRKVFADFCAEYGLDTQATLDALMRIGIEASAKETMKQIAENNDTEPFSVFEAIQQIHAK